MRMDDFVGVLLAGLSGIVVWAAGTVILFTTVIREKRASLLGVRLKLVGIAVAIAGSTIATGVKAVGEGRSWLIVVLLVIFGPVVASLLWLAARIRLTPTSERPLSNSRRR